MARRLGDFRPRYPDDTPPDGCERCEDLGRSRCECAEDAGAYRQDEDWFGDDDDDPRR